MKRYLIKKLLISLFTLLMILTFTFVIMKVIPGDPFMQEKVIPKEVLDAMMKHYGLTEPLWKQYLVYLKNMIQGDLGPSFKYPGRSVNDIIADGFPVSAILGLEALLIAISCGISLGTIAALYHKQWQDRSAMILSVLGISVPSFIMATLLQYVFAIELSWLPVARWGSFWHTVLPSLSLSLLPTAFIARLTRTSLIEVLKQDYIRTARAKGLSQKEVIWKHALPNSLFPVISYLGPLTASILTGTFVVERIFGIPGIGAWWVNSINNRDYTVIMGITVFYSVLLMIAVVSVDLIYAWLDPRVTLKRETQDV